MVFTIERNMNKGDRQRLAGVSTASIAKLLKGGNLRTEVLVKVSAVLNYESFPPQQVTERIRVDNVGADIERIFVKFHKGLIGNK